MVRLLRKFAGPVLLLLALFVGDQIRINRPDHKFRLTLEIETPQGMRTASHLYSVHPDRGYSKLGVTLTRGDALALDIGGKPLVMLMAHQDEKFDLDDIAFVAVRAFSAAGQRAVFKYMDRLKGSVEVRGKVRPLLATLGNAADPATMRAVDPDNLAATFGAGVALRAMKVEIVPNGYWPVDFGGALGEGVTRDIVKTLPWAASGDAAATALKAAGWAPPSPEDAKKAFAR